MVQRGCQVPKASGSLTAPARISAIFCTVVTTCKISFPSPPSGHITYINLFKKKNVDASVLSKCLMLTMSNLIKSVLGSLTPSETPNVQSSPNARHRDLDFK